MSNPNPPATPQPKKLNAADIKKLVSDKDKIIKSKQTVKK